MTSAFAAHDSVGPRAPTYSDASAKGLLHRSHRQRPRNHARPFTQPQSRTVGLPLPQRFISDQVRHLSPRGL
jgi:hypothetical protein